MKILTIVPIARGIGADTLTYFSKTDAPVGTIVSIPLRKKKVRGLVVDSREATEVKSELKNLDYSIRKVNKIETGSFLSENFIKSAQKIANWNACSVGAVLSQLVPTAILETEEIMPVQTNKPSGMFYETLLLQSDDEEREATYRSIIREEFAKNRSIFFCLPGAEDLLNARKAMEKGIEKYTYTLHGGLSKKEIVSIWKQITTETHPVLILATGLFLSMPRADIGAIILEKESSRGFRMQSRPFLDMHIVAEIIARESGIRLILGDDFLRVETIWKEKNGDYAALSPLKFRPLGTAVCELVDMRQPADMKKKEFPIFGESLKYMLKTASENNEHIFLFCARKGLYPHTVCSDCGTMVICSNCSAPMVLYGSTASSSTDTGNDTSPLKPKNLFVCHSCGERRDAHELCKKCSGWRLLPLGIGIEKVAEEIKTLLPNSNIILIDGDHIKTHKQAVKARDTFYAAPDAILLGTEMALPYLKDKVENTAVVSLDSFFSIPDFKINEKVFHILLTLRRLSERKMIVQTRREDTRVFGYALRGNLLDFYRDEIEERKQASFAPFSVYIKISLAGDKNAVKKQMTETTEFLRPFECVCFEAWRKNSKSAYTMHGVIAIPQGKWPDQELVSKLRALPPQFSVNIDPETLL